ncbi:MAG: hypothetical protein DRH15_09505 [Deltaproteobacteria bacterium]|nr:MAG: hypothetical protein DRH15_09505 [Deltaproteobacteria bacterium]
MKRFGIPMEAFEDYLLFERSKGWWLMRKSPHLVEAAKLKIECAGIRAFHKVGRYIKPTTRLIQYFGKLATKALIELTKDEFARLASGQDIEMKMDLDDGYVILCLEGRVILGLGLWYKGKLVPQIPRKELRPAVLDPLLSR